MVLLPSFFVGLAEFEGTREVKEGVGDERLQRRSGRENMKLRDKGRRLRN